MKLEFSSTCLTSPTERRITDHWNDTETQSRSNVSTSTDWSSANFDFTTTVHQPMLLPPPAKLPEHACKYCGIYETESVTQCNGCRKWFCNGPGIQQASHIVDHLTKAGHKSVSLHKDGPFEDIPLECSNCGCRNIFSLGFINPTPELVVLLCRQPCATQESLEPIQWKTDDWQPLIFERQILTWLVKGPSKKNEIQCMQVSGKQILALEELWKTEPDATMHDLQLPGIDQKLLKVKVGYSNAVEYYQTFDPLIKVEARFAQKLSETPIQEDVRVEWDLESNNNKMAYFMLKTTEADSEINIGDQLCLKHAETGWLCSGVVVKIPDARNDKFGLKMTQNFMITDSCSRFILEKMWNSTPFDRMQESMRKYAAGKSAIPENISSRLLGVKRENLQNEDTSFSVNYKYFNNKISARNLPELNPSQASAVKHALERPLSLIQGPPGTGKTVTSATVVFHMVKSNINRRRGQVLVCAPSNVAVDQLTEKIHQSGVKVVRLYAKSHEDIDTPVSFLALHNLVKLRPQYDEICKLRSQLDDPGQLGAYSKNRYFKLLGFVEREILKNAEVICCTCIGAGDVRLGGFKFDWVLIDESMQATEPECMVPVSKCGKQLVLVGDHCQLGPVVLNQKALELSQSMFKRLVMLGIRPVCLQVQYRMHPMIAMFPSDFFYQSFLTNGVKSSERVLKELDEFWLMNGKPMFFYCCYSNEEIASSGTSYLNRGEASIVEQLVTKLLRCGLKSEQIGVITPYLGQRSYLVKYMQLNGTLAKQLYQEIEVSSVDAFQGREKDFIIISAVRSNKRQGIGFLSDPRRLNVALTRAKYGIVVIGNPVNLRKCPLWNHLLHFYKRNNALVEGELSNLKQAAVTLPPIGKFVCRFVSHQYLNKNQARLDKLAKQFEKSVNMAENWATVKTKKKSKKVLPSPPGNNDDSANQSQLKLSPRNQGNLGDTISFKNPFMAAAMHGLSQVNS